MAVHSWLGTGFLEEVYQEALEIEFKKRNIPYEREKVLKINYRGIILSKYYKADFICYNKILIELKTVNKLFKSHWIKIGSTLQLQGRIYLSSSLCFITIINNEAKLVKIRVN